MRFRPAGVTDLIAAKAKYHKKCLIAYKYLSGKSKKETQKTDIAMILSALSSGYAAERKQILQLSDVWVRYNTHKYRSRLLFDERVMKKVGDLFEFAQPLTRDISSLRASSPIWASEASLARTLRRSLARSRETSFTRPKRRACSQAGTFQRERTTTCLAQILPWDHCRQFLPK